MSNTVSTATRTATTPAILTISKSLVWLVGTAIVALMAYYFIGVDQGAVSAFGNNTYVHEFMHDARHLLGFPCH